MRRIDKRADRVEISPEQLTAIVIDTEVTNTVFSSVDGVDRDIKFIHLNHSLHTHKMVLFLPIFTKEVVVILEFRFV